VLSWPARALTWANGLGAAPATSPPFTVIPRCSPLDLVRLWCSCHVSCVSERRPFFAGNTVPTVLSPLAGEEERPGEDDVACSLSAHDESEVPPSPDLPRACR
jgi:hypothetical protein